MATDRRAALRSIAVGDLFHANATNGASLLCLATAVTPTRILARNVATQIIYDFDRVTGHADWYVHGTHYDCLIDSVAPLPPDIRDILLGLDQKYRESEYRRAEDPGWVMPAEQARLTEEEKRGLLFVSYFYPENPI